MACALAALAVATGLPRVARAEKPSKQACAAASEESQSLRAAGRLLDAKAALLVCAVDACPKLVRADCTDRLAEVERALPTVVFQVVDAAGADVAGVTVVDNGARLTFDGRALALDPGEHAVTFEAPGLPRVERRYVLLEGVKERLERVVLAAPVVAPAPPPPVLAPPQPPPSPPSRAPAFALIGAGVAQLGVGATLVALAANQYGQLQGEGCSPTCSPSSWEPWRTRAIAGDALLATGGATAVAGLVWWIALPSAKPASVGLVATPGGAALRGSF